MIKAVYFDLDNTLVDRAASIEKFTSAFLDHFKTELESPRASRIADLIQSIDNGGYLPKSSKYQKIYQAMGEELALQLDWKTPPEPLTIATFWRSQFPQNSVEMKGARELITKLEANGYHVGVISNGAHESRLKTLAATSFSHLTERLVSSGGFGQKKPAAEIFIRSAEKDGFVPSDCLYVGDHPVNDVGGALAAGMQAAWLEGYHIGNGLPDRAHKVKALSEVSAILKNSLESALQ